MQEYINFVLHSIISDMEAYYHWWMLLIVPAVIYTIILVFKYAILTLPILLPFYIIISAFKNRNNGGEKG